MHDGPSGLPARVRHNNETFVTTIVSANDRPKALCRNHLFLGRGEPPDFHLTVLRLELTGFRTRPGENRPLNVKFLPRFAQFAQCTTATLLHD